MLRSFSCAALLLATSLFTQAAAAAPFATAENGMPIPAPTDKTTVDVREGGATVKVPAGMVLVPAGKFIFGEGAAAREIELAVFCIGRSATNGAERGKQVNEVRGGSWYFTGRSGMSLGTGEGRARSGGYHSVGFRVVMTPPPAPDR